MAIKEKHQDREARGFAAMDEAQQRAIASKGGKAAHEKGTAHQWTSEEAREAGRRSAQNSSAQKRLQAERASSSADVSADEKIALERSDR